MNDVLPLLGQTTANRQRLSKGLVRTVVPVVLDFLADPAVGEVNGAMAVRRVFLRVSDLHDGRAFAIQPGE